ncbi:MAG: HAMP domain-containing protein [Gammaproteobacteria bacterium]|nr:HAMP domain-containing protein [Gammaproteobacteria bacterium]
MSPKSLLRSSHFRIALLYLGLFAGSVGVLGVFFYWSTVGYLTRQTDTTIETEIEGLAEQYRQLGLEGLVRVIGERIARDPYGASVYLFARTNLSPIAGNLSRWPRVPVAPDGWLNFTLYETTDGEPHPARARGFRLRGGLHLLVGRDIRELVRTEKLILSTLASGLAVTLALGLAGGVTLALGARRRIERINQTSRRIMHGDLGQRVPLQGSGDDFDQLAGNLNAMLDRIEQLMAAIRHVSNTIAHELRTPLTRLRHRLEQLEIDGGGTDDTADQVEACIAEADRLLATFNALLRIARIETGAHPAADEVRLDIVTADACELYEALAEERGQTLATRLEPELAVRGDRDLLFQAISNLIDNAIKYAPAGSRIDIALTRGARGPELSVADHGRGIAVAERARVTERFYRGEDATGSTAGAGLGLTLVSAVAELHGAELRLQDNAPGLRVVLAFRAPGSPAVAGADAATWPGARDSGI